MFEDSTFESSGSIHTRSRRWMIATFAVNSAVLMALILFPLLYPQALPRMMSAMLMVAPSPQPEQQKAAQPLHPAPATSRSEMMGPRVLAPSVIPNSSYAPAAPEPLETASVADWASSSGSGNALDVFRGRQSGAAVREAQQHPARISQGVMDGLLIDRVIPAYPSLARAMGLEGTVVLQANISKSGTIENLRVVSGPALLRQAAIDAVSRWRYRPYLLNSEPVEVETTINVNFTLH